jgi:hypothetical protein
MKPTKEELLATIAVRAAANAAVQRIVNEYSTTRYRARVAAAGDRVWVGIDAQFGTRVWKDDEGVRTVGDIMVDYDETAIRDKLIEAEKVFKERRSK